MQSHERVAIEAGLLPAKVKHAVRIVAAIGAAAGDDRRYAGMIRDRTPIENP